jgi:alpha-L-fucosidase
VLQEQFTLGQRVEKFALDQWDGQGWRPITEATTIGYKRLPRFPEVTTSRVRIRVLESRDCPTLREFGLYKASAKEKKA